ncbi:DUF917 domain-containing protein [Nocardioides sp. B-3]|uniref:DUF917 domain-containing protein n=1 Tax=Nocardioides sp. B-3 TaxID=2895565 RepID=UPI0021529450|nr:DUF917 domain-containing protein [Nocardioides sp. B-3]UUZ59029.1 DUF917 domain-containing protein [Nocardioides sp. B-3]
MWQLVADDVEALALGASMLGSGGGGSTRVAALMAERLVREAGSIDVLDANEMPQGAYAAPVGLIGSVTVFEEKPPRGDEVSRALGLLERHTGRKLHALLPFESAGVNALLAVCSAASLKLPLVDADGMGRAFPQLDQTVFTLHDLPVSPMVLSDEKGSLVVVDGVNHLFAEELARSNVVTMGGWAMLVMAPQSASDLVRFAIPHSIRRAVEVGRLMKQGGIPALLTHAGGRALFRGRIVEVSREQRGRFGGGSAAVQHVDTESGRLMRIEFQNENPVAVEDGVVRACVPDIICLVDAERMRPVLSEELRYGLEVEVIVLPCPLAWRTPSGLGPVGPRAFGYDVPYVIPRGEP